MNNEHLEDLRRLSRIQHRYPSIRLSQSCSILGRSLQNTADLLMRIISHEELCAQLLLAVQLMLEELPSPQHRCPVAGSDGK